jgi:hypothetical protein
MRRSVLRTRAVVGSGEKQADLPKLKLLSYGTRIAIYKTLLMISMLIFAEIAFNAANPVRKDGHEDFVLQNALGLFLYSAGCESSQTQ